MCVLFTSVRPLCRAENLKAVYDAYDGEKKYIKTIPNRNIPDLEKYDLQVTDELVNVSAKKCLFIGHGMGLGKTYGLDQPNPYYRNPKAIDCAIASSKEIVPQLSKQLGLPEEKIHPIGMPRTDAYFHTEDIQNPYWFSGRNCLYAPTFRTDDDYEYNFDGMSYEDFKTNLRKCATVADIRNIAEKYNIKVPKRLKKEELVALVSEGLRRQGKYDETTEAQLKKMSAITLQRFAKVNGINASTEMKKADVVEYIMNHIESSKAVRKPRIELVTLPEISDFEFSRDYLREVNVVNDEEDEPTLEQLIVVEEPVVEEAPVEDVVEEVVEEPVVEEVAEEPVVEEVVEEVAEEPVAEEEIEEPVVEEEIEEAAVEEVIEEPEYEEILIDETEYYDEDEDEEVESPYNDELLATIVRLLEERERRDVVNEVLEDNRFNSMVKLYEERIAYLEKMIQDMRSTPIPINIQVTYPNVPQVKEVVGNDETEILDETPEEVIETAPETLVSEDAPEVEEPVVEEAVTPITLDSTFDGLTDEEKAQVVKAEMKNADRVEFDASVEPTIKETKSEARKLRKLEKKRAKIQKIRDRNDIRVYRKHNRKKFRRFILVLLLIAVLVFAALLTAGALVDFSKVPENVAQTIDKYLAYLPPFGPGGQIRVWFKDVLLTIFHFVDDLLGLKK